MADPMAELDDSELRRRLDQAASRPAGPLDAHDLRLRAGRIRRRRTIATGVAAVALLLPLVMVAGAIVRPPAGVEFAGPAGPASGPLRGADQMERAPLPGDAVHPGITMAAEFDRTTVRQGTLWYGTLTVTNSSDQPVDLGPWECWEVWGLFSEGTYRGGQAGLACMDEPVAEQWVLEPGQSASFQVPFDTLFEDADGLRYEGNVLPAGDYAAVIGLRVRSDRHDYSGTWYAPPVRVMIEPS